MTRSLWPIVAAPVEQEGDVVMVRQRARRLAELLGFEARDQTRIATAVSEIARNAFDHAGGGRAEFALDGGARPQVFVIRISDRGPGIPDLDAVLEGHDQSSAGPRLGISGARRLMDLFRIEPAPVTGCVVTLGKARPRHAAALARTALSGIADRFARERSNDPLSAMREQNRELMGSLDELRERKEELQRLNRELEDTNRGVVALYAELDQKAEQLRQASELKSRFLSNMSHEFRTPLNSILALARLLLDRVDGPLTEEQERQVTYIRRSAEGLSELVNDLLDLAKVEAGKVELHPAEFTVPELFGALRGALKPLRTSEAVDLVFEAAASLPPLFTDEGKVAQVLRNLISNALKFTERGEVRVSALHNAAAGLVMFSVRDTGIGIAPADQERIFEEFAQIDSRIQSRVKGTGLGLPLSRRLAGLLGGELRLESAPGKGSTFSLLVPLRRDSPGPLPEAEPGPVAGPTRRVLIIDDEDASRYILRRMVMNGDAALPCEVVEASGGEEGLRLARELRPDAILLDLHMPGRDGYAVLRELAAQPETRGTPVIVATSTELTPEVRERLAGVAAVLSKQGLTGAAVAAALGRVMQARAGG